MVPVLAASYAAMAGMTLYIMGAPEWAAWIAGGLCGLGVLIYVAVA